MNIIEILVKEFEQEAQTTRKMLKLVPVDKFDWAPHEKSMKIKNLAIHIAEIAAWPAMMIGAPELDFAKMDYKPTEANSTEDIVAIFEKSYKESKPALEHTNEGVLEEQWLLRTGEKIHMTMNKYEAVRHSFNQTIHHRAQLGVYLRLLNIPIPGTYGPSADEMEF